VDDVVPHALDVRVEGDELVVLLARLDFDLAGCEDLVGERRGVDALFDHGFEELAALVAQILNGGRRPDPAPEWWPDDLPVTAGENARTDEISALLMGGSFDSFDELLPVREQTLTLLRDEVDGLGTPWRMLPPQPQAAGALHKATLVFDPERAHATGDAWRAIGWEAAGQMLAAELITEVAGSYPVPWEPASGFQPTSRPWAWSALVPDIDPQAFPNAAYLAASCHLLPHAFLARRRAGDQLLVAMKKLDGAVREGPALQEWAATRPRI